MTVLGPAEAPLFKLQNYYRYHCLLQSKSAAALHEVMQQVLKDAPRRGDVDWTVDVDPLGML